MAASPPPAAASDTPSLKPIQEPCAPRVPVALLPFARVSLRSNGGCASACASVFTGDAGARTLASAHSAGCVLCRRSDKPAIYQPSLHERHHCRKLHAGYPQAGSPIDGEAAALGPPAMPCSTQRACQTPALYALDRMTVSPGQRTSSPNLSHGGGRHGQRATPGGPLQGSTCEAATRAERRTKGCGCACTAGAHSSSSTAAASGAVTGEGAAHSTNAPCPRHDRLLGLGAHGQTWLLA